MMTLTSGNNGLEYTGFWYKGRFYPPIKGGDGTDDKKPSDEGKGDKGDKKDNGTTDDGDDDDGDEGEDTDDKSGTTRITLSTRTLSARLERSKRRTREAVAKEAGYQSYAAMQRHFDTKSNKDKDGDDDADTKKTDKKDAPDNSEIAKLTKRLDALAEENATLKRGNKAGDLRRVVEKEAIKLHFIDPEDAWAIGKFGDILEELVDDKGQADEDAIIEALETLAEGKPHLITKKRKKSSNEDDDEEDDEEEDDNTTKNSKRSSNSSPNPPRGGSGAGTATITKKKQAEFDRRFPHLSKLRKKQSL